MNIVILAAGQGKRMRAALPKVLHPVAGRPMLAHVLDSAHQAAALVGVTATVVIVVGHGADAVREAFAEQARFALQAPQWGTGHAVLQALPLLGDSDQTLVLYGDVPLIQPARLSALAQAARAAEASAHKTQGGLALLTVLLDDATGYGRVLRDATGAVRRIVEEKDATAKQRQVREVNTGILVAPTARLRQWLPRLTNANAQHEFYLTDIIAMAVADAVPVVTVAAAADETYGVNSQAQLAHVERLAQMRTAQGLMDEGVRLADPARLDVRGQLHCGSDVFIDVNAVFEGQVALGARVRIGPGCVVSGAATRLQVANDVHIGPYCLFEGQVQLGQGVRIGAHAVIRDCVIDAGTVVQPYCHLESATIGRDAQIGPFARTRPHTQLADGVHIGNFVEVKNATMGAGSKANHLSYVGDATVGCDVNIGAGTIIANYDGANKHRTVIGDRAHTGSNSVLVAPIEVGADATVGAGSTVSFKVPAGKLTVARARQVTHDGWVRPKKKPA